jgi:hypothetical protein
MPASELNTPRRLSIFVTDIASGLPISGLPVYAEILVRGDPNPSPSNRQLDDQVVQALRDDDEANLLEPEPRQRLVEVINSETVGQLNDAGITKVIAGDVGGFLSKVIDRIRKNNGGAPLRDIDAVILRKVARIAIAEIATRLQLELRTQAAEPTPWAYPLGVLASDHVGYLSFDLSSIQQVARAAVVDAMNVRRQGAPNPQPLTVALYPAGPSGPAVDALVQGRTTATGIVHRLAIVNPEIPDQIRNLGLPAMQAPALEDWRLSPGSFATNPGLLVGADGCETILPTNLALQEFYFYQVIAVHDLEPPIAPVLAKQVRFGVVNEYRLAWHPLGHSLGQILYSLPLAPGESVNLAVIDWTRRDEAQRKERTTVDEQLVHNEHRDRTISETVDAALREYQHGSTFMGGIAGAVGGSSGAVSGGIAGSLGGSTASTSGTRNLSAKTVQQLSDNVSQVSAATRELQSTVVVQSNAAEKEAIETRTIVNYNHSHTLSVLYYEVLRHFRVVTEFVRRRPAILVRIPSDSFGGKDAIDHLLSQRAVLAPVLLDARFAGGFDAAVRLGDRGGDAADLTKPLPPPPPPPPPNPNLPPHFRFFTFEMMTGGFHREVDGHDSRVDVLASLLIADGSRVDLVNAVGNHVLNNFGSFSQENTNNIFTAVPQGVDEVPWDHIIGIVFGIVVFPTDWDTAKVSLQHIKVTGIDESGVPGTNMIDQGYEGGHLIITNGNDETGRNIMLPSKRPLPPPLPVPQFAPEVFADRTMVLSLITHLDQHIPFYRRAVALGQNHVERATALDAIKFTDGSSVYEHVDNRPLEVIGDYLAYPSSSPDWEARIAEIDNGPQDEVMDLFANDERLVSMPTRGVFAEAKLGHCNASEEIDNTRFWDWQQSPIPHFAPEIAPTTPVTPQPGQVNLSPTALPSSIVNIVNPSAAPDPTGLSSALNVLATPNIFRDLSGQAQVAAVLQNLADNAVKVAGLGGGVMGNGGAAQRTTGTGAAAIGGARAMPNQPSATNRDLQDLSKQLGQWQSSGLMTPEVAQKTFADAVAGTGAIENVGSTIGDVRLWLDLITYVPPASAITGLTSRNIRVQSIFDAMGELNTDFYAVKIPKLPSKGGVLMTAESLLEDIRLRFNEFVDTSYSEFTPLDPVDAPIWLSASPLGAVIKIDIKGPDNAAVVVAEMDARHWRFCTVETPLLKTGSHPVSGTREFGMRSGPEGLFFYTKGADRPTEILETIFSDVATFPGADKLWRSLQDKVATFVNANGGQAQIVTPYSKRNPWGAVVTLYRLSKPVTV